MMILLGFILKFMKIKETEYNNPYMGYLEYCNLCGNEYPIHKYNAALELDNENWIEYTGIQLLCKKCRE